MASRVDRSRWEPIVVLPTEGELAGDLRGAGVEVLIRPLSVIRRELVSARGIASIGASAVRDGAMLGALIRRRGIALVHSNTSVVLGGAAGALVGSVPHAWHVREIYSRWDRAWPYYRRLLGSAAALPCISRSTAAQFRAGDRRVRVIPDGLALAAPPAPRAEARASLGLSDDVAVVAVLGRISDWKGQDVLVRALAAPALRDREVVGLIVGEAWPGAEERALAVVRLAETLGVSDRLRLLGFRDDVETIYGAADVIAVPSTEPEPLGDVAIEAGAYGCAVVASGHGGLAEIIRDGETGLLVAPGDARALAGAVASLLDDPGARERLGRTAAADVSVRFAPERLVEAVQELYEQTLEARS
jgi:glycosyltransferase involved in cell wall biosynthesis